MIQQQREADLRQAVSEANHVMSTAMGEAAKLYKKAGQCNSELSKMTAALEERQKAYKLTQLQAQSANMTTAFAALQASFTKNRVELAKAEAQVDQMKEGIAQLEEEANHATLTEDVMGEDVAADGMLDGGAMTVQGVAKEVGVKATTKIGNEPFLRYVTSITTLSVSSFSYD